MSSAASCRPGSPSSTTIFPSPLRSMTDRSSVSLAFGIEGQYLPSHTNLSFNVSADSRKPPRPSSGAVDAWPLIYRSSPP